MCPGKSYEDSGRCIALCGDDSHCSNGQKCCSNGCGTECETPITDECKDFYLILHSKSLITKKFSGRSCLNIAVSICNDIDDFILSTTC